ncbi:sensor histidine kinase [Corynebacterium vitaeruminis]|uniref:histidine kinase n=1 Tax=Corynebacterium vitaeruminis DSM 20294 TaxID=1224164 RepID=W5Y4W9_9CORY|nr:HAMP domain-containing sensor histidine kinase [Corynebacterium vitaeruminis]AHI23934.1 hypothetical protein B843_12790 [Corynebacterium vitaeruminis DSM 20294]
MNRVPLSIRFLLAQIAVAAASLLAAGAIALVIGPRLFHEHLLMAGLSDPSSELTHVEQAYRDAGAATLSVAIIVASLCAGVAGWLLSLRIKRPLTELTRAASDVAQGRYATRVPTDVARAAGPEMAMLTSAFNIMAERIDNTEALRRQLLSDLAHEMATPVSVLGVYCEGLQDDVVEWNQETQDVFDEQLGRLKRLIADIDEVSRAQERRIELHRQPISLAELVQVTYSSYREPYATKGVQLHLRAIPQQWVVNADRQRLGQVLGNLLANALRHTPPGGTVTIFAEGPGIESSIVSGDGAGGVGDGVVPVAHAGSGGSAATGMVRIGVSDTGEGLSPDQQARVFERFYRGDGARSTSGGGSGVGLTIARGLVEAHGGTLSVTSPGLGKGATFTFTLPLGEGMPNSTQ